MGKNKNRNAFCSTLNRDFLQLRIVKSAYSVDLGLILLETLRLSVYCLDGTGKLSVNIFAILV